MAIITRGTHPKDLWPGLQGHFHMLYESYGDEWQDLFDVVSSNKAYEEAVQTVRFGLAPVKTESSPVQMDQDYQGYTSRIVNVTYALGYGVTEEEIDDNLYPEVSQGRTAALAYSMKQTKNFVHANVYNRAFDSNYPGGDGVELLATDHPTLFAGDQSNELAVAADLSEKSIEDLIIQIMEAEDDRGNKIKLMPNTLHIAPRDYFIAHRILESQLRSGSADNDINVLRAKSILPGGVKVNHYFTDNDAWFIRNSMPAGMGMTHLARRAIRFQEDNDFSTKNMLFSATERYGAGWRDWRCIYGSEGNT